MTPKIGNYALIKKGTTTSGYANIAEKEEVPVYVYSINGNNCQCYTKDLSFNNFNNNPFGIPLINLEIITKEEADKIKDIKNKNFLKENKKKLVALKTKYVKITERKDYNLNEKQLLSSGSSFVKVIQKGNFDSPISNNFMVGCCDLTKTTRDLLVYIPKSWANYFGYNLSDLRSWLKFLEKCEIGFKADILSICNLYDKFKKEPVTKHGVLLNANCNFYLSDKEKAYEILLSGCGYSYGTYLYFILIRYFWHSRYWNIPFIAMKLKKNMPKATHWECLLLAHNAEIYSGSNCLTQTYNKIVLGSVNDPTKIIAKVNEQGKMNNSFVYTEYDRLIVENWIKTENYTELQKLLNTYK